MSKPPFMIDCPRCVPNRSRIRIPGFVERVYGEKDRIHIADVCERCGGSGRIAVTVDNSAQYKINRRFAKHHKIEMRKWLEMEKELVYGKAERIE